jgi:hypothetical protein
MLAKVDTLSHKLDKLMATGFVPTLDISYEQVNAALSRLGNDPYSNSYNLGWRNHNNFSWCAPPSGNPPANYSASHQQYQLEPPSRSSDFEDKVLVAIIRLDKNTQLLHSHSQSIVKLEAQVRQIANTLNMRDQGKLPS